MLHSRRGEEDESVSDLRPVSKNHGLRVGRPHLVRTPRFIPESMFYTQSIMLSPRFIPKYSVRSPQSAVRSPLPTVCSLQPAVRSPQSVVHVLYWPCKSTKWCLFRRYVRRRVDLPRVDCENPKARESQDDESEGRSPETSDEVASRLVPKFAYCWREKKKGCDVTIWQSAPPRKMTSQYRPLSNWI